MVLLSGMFSAVYADDINPPIWQRGAEGATYQQWEYSTDDTTPAPEFLDNPYGAPQSTVIPIGSWESSWGGRNGVWPLSGVTVNDIPNSPVENPYKWVWIQLTWAAEEGQPGALPCISVTAEGIVTSLWQEDQLLEPTNVPGAGEYWHHTTYLYRIEPNPREETITIGSAIMVDELVIDTLCAEYIPEPATLSLIGFGGVVLLRRLRRG